jgi:exonuclease SbcD
MKILHTSDLHIGHTVNGIDRSDEFKKAFKWLYETIEKEKVDVLIISGDVFDVYFPSTQAVGLYYDFLLNLKTMVQKVVIIGGNHDSPKHLKAPKEILKYLDVIVVSGAEDDYKEIIEFDDFEIVAVSFLREHILKKFDVDMIEAFKKIYKRKSQKKLIATGHLTVHGSEVGSSEREIYIGKIESVPSGVFEGYDYVALGHIHKPQEIKKGIVYSGSLLQLGFNENYQKKVVLLETQNMEYKFLDVPKFREFYSLKGSFEEVREKIEHLEEKSFVEIELNEIVSSLSLDELRRDDLFITKINMPFKRLNSNISLKTVSPEEFIKEIFKDDEDLDEMLEIVKKLKAADED